MDIATCTLNRKDYTIWQFNQLPKSELEELRRHLICTECSAKAYYRKQARDGKPACFGARPHNAGCSVATSGTTPEEQRDIEDVNKIITDDESIRVNFDLPIAAATAETQDAKPAPHEQGPSNHRYTRDPAQQRIASRGLKTLLNYVMRVPSFAQSDTIIYTDANFFRRAKDLLVKFEDAKPNNKPFLFWGMISHASEDLTWLNTGGKESVSIPISNFKTTITKALDTEDTEDYAGAYAIVFGWCKSSGNGKLFIQTKDGDPRYIFLKPNKQ